ncbi:reverse transcriptase domain-containing protein, partial [Tanacetum coccineum]
MLADSAITYTSVHSEATIIRVFPSEDPFEEGARQLREQATTFSSVFTRSMELEDQVTVAELLIPEANTPPRKRPLLTTPRPECEETRFRDTERRMMTALEMVNMRASYQVDVRSRESLEFQSRHHDAQKDHAAVRAEIEVLRRERLAYEQESMETRQALARSEAHCRALEARVTVLETEVRRHEWQRQAADDLAVQHIMQNGTKTSHKGILRSQQHQQQQQSTTLCGHFNANLLALIDQGVVPLWLDVRTGHGVDSHTSGKGLSGDMNALLRVHLPGIAAVQTSLQGKGPCTEAIEMAITDGQESQYDCGRTKAENMRNRKFENTSRNNQNQQQQQQNKRQNTGRAYTAGSGDKKQYGGSRPLCSKCNYHHDGPCAPKCYKCNKYGHIARDCRGTGNANNINNQKGTGSGQKPTCFECEGQGHFKKECPRMKNNKGNRGNQAENDRAPAKVYVVGNTGANLDNVVAGMFLLNNRYAYILFDTGADQSFVSTAFSSQIDIIPSTLDHYYDVKLADGMIIGLNAILKGCTLNFP